MANEIKPKDFHIGDVLSVLFGIVLSPKRFLGVVYLMEYMAEQKVTFENSATFDFTQIGADCSNSLIQQLPKLTNIMTPVNFPSEVALDLWVQTMAGVYGERQFVYTLREWKIKGSS